MSIEHDAMAHHELKEKFRQALDDVAAEYVNATRKFDTFNSSHEGHAVIREEFDELWYEVMNNKHPETKQRQRKEAVQTAAMCLRFIVECCD